MSGVHPPVAAEPTMPSTPGFPRRARWLIRLGSGLLRLLGLTWRMRVVHGESALAEVRRTRQPIIFALWHGDMLPLLYHHRNEGVAVLISEHTDGEMIARVAERLGFRTVRGSSSRGASRALVGLVRSLEAGHDVAVTPDGPRGPAKSFAPGALMAAQRSGAPILSCGVAISRYWQLRSWDSFRIPKPFSRVSIAYVGPELPQGTSMRAAADETGHFESLMADAERLAHG